MSTRAAARLVAAFAALITSVAAGIPAVVTAPAADCPAMTSPIVQICDSAERHKVDPDVLIALAQCESSLRHEGVYGDSGLAYGIMQFHEPTFEMFKKEAGMPDLEYKGMADQIELAAWALQNGLGSHWTCFAPPGA